MKLDLQVDASQLERALNNIDLTADDLLQIEGAGAAVVAGNQKLDVPVDTAATRNSIKSHIVTSTRTRIEDDIGPETDYAPYIEYGVASKPNYPIQPFVVPSATGMKRRDCQSAISTAFGQTVVSKWTT